MQYVSDNSPQSEILKNTFLNRLNAVYGYHINQGPPNSDFEKRYGLEFVRVDLSNPAYQVKSAALGSIFDSKNLSKSLEKYFDAYLRETSLSYNDIAERQQRLNELSFMCYNDPVISRCVSLVADEATQIDVQNRIISCESPNMAFSQKVYELLSVWGVTPNTIHSACYDIELYGEAFWSQKITMKGIEKIKPLAVNNVKERLEFSPERMAKYLAERDGYMKASKDRMSKLQTLIDNYKNGNTIDFAENFSDMFDTKLLGFEVEDGNIIPPWVLTHFRFDPEHSEFFPYGRPPLLHCLAPFKQCYSTIALQGLARSMSFPVTLYKVKTAEGSSPGRAFELVGNVRQEYDNIGLTSATAGSEVYTVNTKIWVAENLMDVEVKESKVDMDFIGDIEMHQDRMFIAAGVPKGYLNQEYGGFGQSGVALMEQYKPFARMIYSIQTAFLEGLGQLIRLHFAITGEFDYNTPFVLSMRFPAAEFGEEQRNARQASVELSTTIMDLLKSVLGIEEGSPLPEDVIVDILSKYSFLDATDIQKWVRLSSFLKPSPEVTGEDEDMGGDDGGFDMGGGGDDMGFSDDGGGDLDADLGDDAAMDDGGMDAMPENTKAYYERRKYLKKLNEERLREISSRYKTLKDDIYIRFLESNNMTEFVKLDSNTNSKYGRHSLYIPKVTENSVMHDIFSVMKSDNNSSMNNGLNKLKEKSVEEVMEEKRSDYDKYDPIASKVKQVVNRKEDY